MVLVLVLDDGFDDVMVFDHVDVESRDEFRHGHSISPTDPMPVPNCDEKKTENFKEYGQCMCIQLQINQ